MNHLDKLTPQERVAWAQSARPSAESRYWYEINQGRYANALERAEDEFEFCDWIIAHEGALP